MKQLNEYTEIELKALVYDEMAKLEIAQKNIQIINQELANRANKSVEEPKAE